MATIVRWTIDAISHLAHHGKNPFCSSVKVNYVSALIDRFSIKFRRTFPVSTVNRVSLNQV